MLGELADYIADFVWVREADSGAILYRNDVWGKESPVSTLRSALTTASSSGQLTLKTSSSPGRQARLPPGAVTTSF